MQGCSPLYLGELLVKQANTRTLRSNSKYLLQIPLTDLKRLLMVCTTSKTMRVFTPVSIDARASINSESASFHIKVHRSISKVNAHHFVNFWGSSGGDLTLGGQIFTQWRLSL